MQGTMAQAHSGVIPADSIGTWRRFGSLGPVYEIIANGPDTQNGVRSMRVRVVESGEEADYSIDDILGDPRES